MNIMNMQIELHNYNVSLLIQTFYLYLNVWRELLFQRQHLLIHKLLPPIVLYSLFILFSHVLELLISLLNFYKKKDIINCYSFPGHNTVSTITSSISHSFPYLDLLLSTNQIFTTIIPLGKKKFNIKIISRKLHFSLCEHLLTEELLGTIPKWYVCISGVPVLPFPFTMISSYDSGRLVFHIVIH